MKNIVTFINMDGYGYYVWPAFSLTILILLIMAIAGFLKLKSNKSALYKVSERKNKTRKEIKSETQA
jgi:heme exporter protein D